MKGKSLESRLTRYEADSRIARQRRAKVLAGVMLTAGAACVGIPAVEAAIVYHDENPDKVVNSAAPLFQINIGGANRFTVQYWPAFASVTMYTNNVGLPSMAGGAHLLKYFAAPAPIGSGENWVYSWQRIVSASSGSFLNKEGYVGVRFQPVASWVYGWIRIAGAAGMPPPQATIRGWAYQDNGSSINAGVGQ